MLRSRDSLLRSKRLAVENATKMSPLPLPDHVPVRARPRVARRDIRSSWRDDTGASVAMTTITEPSRPSTGASRAAALGGIGISSPTGTPPIINVLRLPKLAWSSTPTVKPPRADVNRRDAVPMPPLNS